MQFIKSTLVIGTPGPINLDEVITFEKFLDDNTKEENGKFQIMFVRESSTNSAKYIFWKYASECNRNAEHDKLIELYTVNL